MVTWHKSHRVETFERGPKCSRCELHEDSIAAEALGACEKPCEADGFVDLDVEDYVEKMIERARTAKDIIKIRFVRVP